LEGCLASQRLKPFHIFIKDIFHLVCSPQSP
jgi:hypothetical protein